MNDENQLVPPVSESSPASSDKVEVRGQEGESFNETPGASKAGVDQTQITSTLDSTWSHKDLWSKRGNGFCVEVSHHSVPLSSISPELGEHRWCVYAYIYPDHPHFAKFDGSDSFFQDACQELPLHGGVISNASYLRYHYTTDGKMTCVQVGQDYNHLHDEQFTHLAPAKAAVVLFDGDRLFRWLTEKASFVGRGSKSDTASGKQNPPSSTMEAHPQTN